MYYRSALLIASFLILLQGTSSLVMSQDILTLQQALSEAKTLNLDMQAERLRLSVVKSHRTLAGLFIPFNPEFEFGILSDRLSGSQGNNGYSLSLSQEIEIAGQRGKRIKIADLALDQVQAEIARAERLLEAEVKISYHRLALGREKLQEAGAILTLRKRLATAAEQRFRTGDVSELEVNLVLAERDLVAVERFGLEIEAQAAETRLNLLLGRPAGELTTVTVDTTYLPLHLDLEQLVQRSLGIRQDLKAMWLEEQGTEKGIGLARAGAIPNPRLTIAFDQERTTFANQDFTDDPAIIGGLRNIRSTDRLLRVQLAVPLPFLNRNQAGVQEAKAENNVARARRGSMERRIRMEVTESYQRFVGNQQSLASYRMLLPRVEQNATLLVSAYEAGELDLTALLVQTDRIFRMRIAYFDAVIAYREAFARLEQAVGGPVQAPQPH